VVVARVEPDVEVAPEGAGHLLGEEAPERTAIDAPQHLAHQMSLVEGVVARGRARLPPRRLGGEHGGGALQSKMSSTVTAGPSRHARGVREDLADQHPLLAVGGELGPVPGDRRVDVEEPRSASTRAQRLVMVLVVDHTLVIVSSPHGDWRPSSDHPPHRSTTGWPSTVTATDAPRSSPLSRLAARMSRSALNRPSKLPFTSPESLMRPLCRPVPRP